MDDVYQDRFVVFVRNESGSIQHPETFEEVVADCYSHEEALRIRQEFRAIGQHCIIRCLGPSGGGD